jgi:hypothetical protein
MYCVWPKNSSGAYGRPVFVNRTEAWWVGSDKSWVGGSVSIHGRNLSYQNGTSTSHVYLKSSSGTITACTETSVNPYRVTFTVPSVANGTYEVWVHNGHGGRYGWSKSPNSLIVGAVQAWSGTINVTSAPYNAQGNGSTDDRAAIQAAINAAAANSTVYFPTGTYIINGPLTLKSNIRLAGDSKTLSTIKLGSGYVTSGQGAIVLNAGTANVKFQSIGIDFNAENVGAEGGIYARNCSDITFASFKLSSENMAGGGNVGLSGGGDRMDFQNTNYVYWDSVDYIGSMMFFGASKHVYCTNSNIYMTNDANSVFVMWGVKWFSITNTTLQNLANTTTGQGKGRFVSGTGIWGATGNHYFGNNQIIRVCPRQATGVDQNSGEVFMYEGNKSFWIGQPTNTTATTFGTGTFSGGGGLLAFINAGKGLGQWRRVTSNFNGVATIDRAWDVIPDGTSKITIGVYQSNIAVYNNDFSGQQIAVTSSTHIANTAVEPFGGCVNYIVDGNTIDTMRYAIGNYATRHASGVGGLSNDPTYWCIYQNNTINYTRWPVTNNYQPGEPGTAAAPQTTNGMALFGIVYRNNTVTNSLIATEENGAINTLAPTITNCFIYERGFTPISTAIPNKVAYTNP